MIVFDRGVNTDCPATFIHPIGGYAYGADGAEFLVDNLEPGGKVLALRILPGVDVLENRWAAASKIFDESDLEVVGDEFTGGDGAKIKDLVTQYLQRGDVDGIWMDAGDGAVAAIEAFEDAGKDYPVMVGEDELSFLRKWQETEMTAIAPVYSNFQWRTPILAAQQIWDGEEVPEGVGAAAGADHRRRPRRVPRPEQGHAEPALRQVRRRGPARLPGRLEGPLTR